MTMANSILIRLECLHLLMCIFVCGFTIGALPTSSSIGSFSKHEGLVLRLVHKDSIHLPNYLPGSTLEDQINSILSSSRSRLHYLGWRANQTHKKPRAPLIPVNNGFMVQIWIGKPPIRQWVHMDMGSNFLWIQCNPCKTCHKTENLLYNPNMSTSFSNSSCHEGYCKDVPGGSCGEVNRCKFDVRYMNGSQSIGHVGFETLSFEAVNGRIQVLPSVMFGCARLTNGSVPVEDGVLGLCGLKPSLPLLTNGKFSYCIGSISDPNYNFHRLALGNHTRLDGNPVPLKISPQGYYMISLEGINIGGIELTINPKDYEFNVIIDPGSRLSFLRPDTYEAIKSEVQTIAKIIGLQEVRLPGNPDSLCYKGNLQKDLGNIPPSYLWLRGTESYLAVGKEGIFWDVPGHNAFCLSFEPTKNGTYIIGAIIQQHHNVGFDLNSKKAFFDVRDCTDLS